MKNNSKRSKLKLPKMSLERKLLNHLLKYNKNSLKDDKIEKADLEKLYLEAEINFYKLQQATGTSFDEEEEKEQRRRLWKLSIIKNKEDDEFLKKLGLVHISKITTPLKLKRIK